MTKGGRLPGVCEKDTVCDRMGQQWNAIQWKVMMVTPVVAAAVGCPLNPAPPEASHASRIHCLMQIGFMVLL